MPDNSNSEETGGDDGLFGKTSDTLNEVQYDPAGDQGLAAVIVQAIADQTGKDTETYRESPLHDYIDIDAIETLLFGTRPNQSLGPAVRNISFQYRDFLVTVRADGVIQVSDTDSNSVRKD